MLFYQIKSFIKRKIFRNPLDKWDYYYANNDTDNNNSTALTRNNIIATYIQYLKPNAKILDVGCGDGNFLNSIKYTNCESYLGIDISSIAINIAKAQGYDTSKNVSFEVDDMMEFSTRVKYDVILFNETICYCPSAVVLLKLYNMFLSSEGIFIVGVTLNDFTFDTYRQILNSGFKIKDETVVQNSRTKYSILVISGS